MLVILGELEQINHFLFSNSLENSWSSDEFKVNRSELIQLNCLKVEAKLGANHVSCQFQHVLFLQYFNERALIDTAQWQYHYKSEHRKMFF